LRLRSCIKIGNAKTLAKITFHQQRGNETDVIVEIAENILDASQVAEPMCRVGRIFETVALQKRAQRHVLCPDRLAKPFFSVKRDMFAISSRKPFFMTRNSGTLLCPLVSTVSRAEKPRHVHMDRTTFRYARKSTL
jgi:hypothetical protein